ncbi:MAG: tetratricopeptide repeat protein [Chitinophagaceae bacterium]|nr:MAG: tetratricopeptide repeat protein [Chitinophagaceae bacterium]
MEKGDHREAAPAFICRVKSLLVNSGMRKVLLVILLILSALVVPAQDLMNLDSLLRLLPDAREDSNRVLLYIRIGQQYEGNNPQLAADYYRSAGILSRKIGYTEGELKYIANYTYILNTRGLFDSSLLLNLQAVDIARRSGDKVGLAKALVNTGTSYRELSQYGNAVAYYEQGRSLLEELGNEVYLAQAYDYLQLLYMKMHQFNKGAELGEKALVLFRRPGSNPLMLIPALNNIGMNYTGLKQYSKALERFRESLALSEQVGDHYMELTVLLNLSDLEIQQGRYPPARPYLEKALVLSREMEAYESELICVKGLSFIALSGGDIELSERLLNEALDLSFKYNIRSQRTALYTHYSNIAYAKHDMRNGELYATMSSQMNDSLMNEGIARTTVELEQKYAAERKQNQIIRLESEKKEQQFTIARKNTLNAVLIAGAVVLVVLMALLYRNYRQKQKIQVQRIIELEAEKQLAATEAVLKGEELERTRLARDLHDGLGGMLSGIKYSLNNMKGNLIMTPENAQAFERSVDMLDSSIKEMRRVAHNMMPEALVKFGLDEALKDFCNDINQSGALKVNYQSIGLAGREIEQTMSITIYRIVQELINNTMKHAAATNAIVQVTMSGGQLSVTVEDDGKGFDTTILSGVKGIGWSNIQNRVEFLKGRMDVNSAEGKGTSVLIEIGLQP